MAAHSSNYACLISCLPDKSQNSLKKKKIKSGIKTNSKRLEEMDRKSSISNVVGKERSIHRYDPTVVCFMSECMLYQGGTLADENPASPKDQFPSVLPGARQLTTSSICPSTSPAWLRSKSNWNKWSGCIDWQERAGFNIQSSLQMLFIFPVGGCMSARPQTVWAFVPYTHSTGIH